MTEEKKTKNKSKSQNNWQKNKKKGKRICPECRGEVEYNSAREEFVCTKCGLVIEGSGSVNW